MHNSKQGAATHRPTAAAMHTRMARAGVRAAQHAVTRCSARITLSAWRPHAAAANEPQPAGQGAGVRSAVPVPLCRRPAGHEDSLDALLDWRSEVLKRIQAVGDTFEAADGGPGRELLQREVAWALDDAVAAYREGASAAWRPATWQQLEQEIQTAQRRASQLAASSSGGGGGSRSGALEGWQVQLRAPVAELRQLWRRRLEERVPFQYLLASAHWRDLVLSVGPGVLVPRPETEQMIDMAAAALGRDAALARAPWADLGTGSGALAVGLARLLAARRGQQGAAGGGGAGAGAAGAPAGQLQQSGAEPLVWAVEFSEAARPYAEANAAACAPPGAVRVAAGSWWQPLAHLRGRLGGVLTNPPYIPRAEMAGLQREVGAHEPHSALDGGDGPGLDNLEVICAGAGDMLVDGGYIAIETAGGEQAERVKGLLEASGAFERSAVVSDCYGVARFVEAWRRRRCGD